MSAFEVSVVLCDSVVAKSIFLVEKGQLTVVSFDGVAVIYFFLIFLFSFRKNVY